MYWDTSTEQSKFKPCSIEFLKDQVVKNGWKGCKKYRTDDDLPINYERVPGECEKMWNKAKQTVQNQGKRKQFENVMKIKVKEDCGDWKLECLNIKLFKERGWCRITNGTIDDWGICTDSCEYVEVLHLYGIFVIHNTACILYMVYFQG